MCWGPGFLEGLVTWGRLQAQWTWVLPGWGGPVSQGLDRGWSEGLAGPRGQGRASGCPAQGRDNSGSVAGSSGRLRGYVLTFGPVHVHVVQKVQSASAVTGRPAGWVGSTRSRQGACLTRGGQGRGEKAGVAGVSVHAHTCCSSARNPLPPGWLPFTGRGVTVTNPSSSVSAHWAGTLAVLAGLRLRHVLRHSVSRV